ncbi:hypothetical protein ACLGL1_04525 [Peptococcus simiae]|uniref:hypothetical protein n=1 Tax=Peptococcus simiae TaxID=1643805 RepID=UPI00397F2F79
MFFTALSKFIQLFINLIGGAFGILLAVLPKSPLQSMLSYTGAFSDFLGVCSFFIPIGAMIAITQAWLVAVALYYIHSAWMRWLKMIE